MATSKEYKNFILEQLSELKDIYCRPMMGEYFLYYRNILFVGIYDERLLIKNVKSNQKYNLPLEIPYPGAKPMRMITNLEDKFAIKEIILSTCESLRPKNKKWEMNQISCKL